MVRTQGDKVIGAEWKVLAVVVLVLAVCEGGARYAGRRLGRDRAHIHDFPRISKELHEAEGAKVLFLGNSLTLHGVSLATVRQELARYDPNSLAVSEAERRAANGTANGTANGPANGTANGTANGPAGDSAVRVPAETPSGSAAGTAAEAAIGLAQPAVDWVVPVGTDITDWIYLFERYFRNVEQVPDVVVVGFVRHHVRDLVPPKRLRRLGRHFLALRDARECFATDVFLFDDRVDLLLSRLWASYGDQPEYRDDALDWFLTGFAASEREINRALEMRQEQAAERQRGDAPEGRPTFRRVERLARLLKDNNAHGIFVAMPLPEPWDHDLEVRDKVQALGMSYVDARSLEGVTADDFPDGYHMGERAKEIYSRFIAGQIAQRLKRSGGGENRELKGERNSKQKGGD